MSRSYPIWNDVEACIYNPSKSYGAKNTSSNTIHVGSGSKHSKELATVVTTRRSTGDYDIFRLFVDGKVIKKKYFNRKTKKFYSRKPKELRY